MATLTVCPPDRTLGPVVGVVDRSLPDRLERGCTVLHHGLVLGQFMIEEVAVTGEVPEPNDTAVEYPKVVSWQAKVRRLASRQPSHLLSSGDVQSGGHRIFEPDVIRQRLGH